jgi:hypothetical protein
VVASGRTWYGGSRGAGLSALLLSAVIGWFFAPFLRLDAILVERDALSFFLPMHVFHARALASGALPWWNPAPVLGKPFLAEWQPGLFYPPSLLFFVRPFELGFNLFYVGHYWITALGALLWLRGRGVWVPAALLGALVWALGGPLVSLGYVLNHLTSITWLPWVLWAWDRGRSINQQVAAAGAMLSLPLLAGSPEMVGLIVLLLLLASRDPRSLAALPIGVCLAAVEILPFLYYLPATYRGAVGLDSGSTLAYSASLAELAQLVRFRGVVDPEPYLRSVYVGLLPVLLAAVALALAPAALRLALVAIVAAIIVLALGANTPIGPFLYAHVPLASMIRFPEKFLLALTALIAAGAAFGCARLASVATRAGSVAAEGRVGLAIGLCLVAAVGLDLARVNRGLTYAAPPQEVLEAPSLARAMLDDAATTATSPAAGLRYYANSIGGPEALSLDAAAELDREILFAAVGELYGLGNLNSPGALNLVAHEQLNRALASVPPAVAIDAMAALGVRYVTSWRVLDSTAGLEAIPISRATRGASLYRVTAAGPRAFIARRIIGAPDAEGAVARFVGAPTGGHAGLAVVELRDAIALPIGARLLRGELVGSSPLRRRAVSWPLVEARPSPAAVLREEPALGEQVQLTAEGSDRLSIDARLDRPGLLVVNDSWFEGWRAQVDGAPAPILRVNGLVRGVWLGSGRHVVRMSYRPRGLIAGCLISLCTAGALVAFVWLGPRTRAGAGKAGPLSA